MQVKRLDEFEGLRGLLAWWVVVGHVTLAFSDRIGGLLRHTSAVKIFIILSGFVIAHLLVNKRETYGPFIIRRFFRIFPAYLLALLVTFTLLGVQKAAILGSLFSTDKNVSRIDLINEALAHPVEHLVAHITMLHGLVPLTALKSADYSILGQAWSISVEWQFYLIAPVVVWLLFRGPVAAAATALAVLAFAHFAVPASLQANDAFMLKYFAWFLIGIGSFWLWQRDDWAARRLVTGLCALLLFVAGVVLRDIGTILWVPVLLMLGDVNRHVSAAGRAILLNPVLMWLGRISYSTYLLHMIALYGSMWVAAQLTGSRAVYALIVIGGTVSVTVLLSYLSFRFVEKPGILLGTRLATGHRARRSQIDRKEADGTQAV